LGFARRTLFQFQRFFPAVFLIFPCAVIGGNRVGPATLHVQFAQEFAGEFSRGSLHGGPQNSRLLEIFLEGVADLSVANEVGSLPQHGAIAAHELTFGDEIRREPRREAVANHQPDDTHLEFERGVPQAGGGGP
jgi:hypothetical protein